MEAIKVPVAVPLFNYLPAVDTVKPTRKGRPRQQKARLTRTCETCAKEFMFRRCYAGRPGRPGRFCSMKCRAEKLYGKDNPNISDLGRLVGVREARVYAQKDRYAQLRAAAIAVLTPRGTSPRCSSCGCDHLPLLQINHKNGGGSRRKESGVKLWRIVRALGPEASTVFNLLCELCNWAEFVHRKQSTIKYEIRFVRASQERIG